MTRRVGILGPKRGPKGIDVRQGQGEDLRFQLAAYGEVSGLAEEVVFVLHFAAVLGHVVQVECGHLEHGTGALGVAGGDDGGLDELEAPVLEEGVDGVGHGVPHPRHGPKGVGAGPQMGDLPEKFGGVAFLLEGIGLGVGAAHNRQ